MQPLERGFEVGLLLGERGGSGLLREQLAVGLVQRLLRLFGDDLLDQVLPFGLLLFERGEQDLVGDLERADLLDRLLQLARIDRHGLGGEGLAELGFEQLLLGGELGDLGVERVELGDDFAARRQFRRIADGRRRIGTRGQQSGGGRLRQRAELLGDVAQAIGDHALVPRRIAPLELAEPGQGLGITTPGGADLTGLAERVGLLDEIVGGDEVVIGARGRAPEQRGSEDQQDGSAEHGTGYTCAPPGTPVVEPRFGCAVQVRHRSNSVRVFRELPPTGPGAFREPVPCRADILVCRFGRLSSRPDRRTPV